LSKLSNLTDLKLSGNSIGDKGAEHLSKLSNLTSLILWDTRIGEKGAEDVSKLSNLTRLTLYANSIGEKGAEHVSKLSNLTNLNLHSNSIGDKGAEHVSKLSNLTSLDFSDNGIGEKGAEYISKLSMLTELNLWCNSIGEKGAEHVSKLSNLTSLDLSFNMLTTSRRFEHLVHLTRLSLRNNPISDVPQSLLTRDVGLLRHWWEETKEDTVSNTIVKLMVNGNGNAGKSTLLEALRHGKCLKKKESTHGIVIERWDYVEVGRAVSFHVWDFGGQELFHGTHRLFMQSEAVWLHVFDPETEALARNRELTADRVAAEEQVRNHVLQFWVDEAGKNHPRIIVQTKKEKGKKNSLSDEAYFKAAPEWNAVFEHVDSKTGLGINGLRSKVHEKALEVTEYGMPMPRKWVEARDHFLSNLEKREDSQKTMSMAEFSKLCMEQFGIREEVVPTLLHFLHNCGVLYYNEQYLNDTIITDQRWALDAIYRPLERGKPFYSDMRGMYKGRVRADVVYRAFGDTYTKPQKQLFLKLMESCGLCYHLNMEVTRKNEHEMWYVFPEFLPEEMPPAAKAVWDVGGKEHRTFRQDMPYLNYFRIQNFIARFGRKTETEFVWRNGIVVPQGEVLFLVEADYEKPRPLWCALQVFLLREH
jgi:small GTP-binding protein